MGMLLHSANACDFRATGRTRTQTLFSVSGSLKHLLPNMDIHCKHRLMFSISFHLRVFSKDISNPATDFKAEKVSKC